MRLRFAIRTAHRKTASELKIWRAGSDPLLVGPAGTTLCVFPCRLGVPDVAHRVCDNVRYVVCESLSCRGVPVPLVATRVG